MAHGPVVVQKYPLYHCRSVSGDDMRTDAQYIAAARRKLGVKAADVLGQAVRDGTVRITLKSGQQHVIPLAELERKGRAHG